MWRLLDDDADGHRNDLGPRKNRLAFLIAEGKQQTIAEYQEISAGLCDKVRPRFDLMPVRLPVDGSASGQGATGAHDEYAPTLGTSGNTSP
jgi:hypothetical protein